jgi:ATP-dependent Clp protease protease subunit
MRILESGFAGEYEKDAFELIVSTNGGSALEMFSIYDTIRMIKEKAPVCTVGLGKVMSAGVLVLACGTKGRRKIGKNCRVMIHGVASGYAGSIHSLENELEEVQWIQQQYIRILAAETDMTQKYIKNLISRKVNVYLTAEQAVEYGIADEVF